MSYNLLLYSLHKSISFNIFLLYFLEIVFDIKLSIARPISKYLIVSSSSPLFFRYSLASLPLVLAKLFLNKDTTKLFILYNSSYSLLTFFLVKLLSNIIPALSASIFKASLNSIPK